MQLHFTKDVLPDSVGTDFQNLNKLNEQQFHRLIEILFQFLLEPKETERFMQQLTEFAGEHGMSAGPLRNLMKSVLLVPQGALKKNLTGEQIKEDLLTLGTHPSPLCLRVILTVVVLVTVTFVLMKANLLTLIIFQD
uniref:COMM domain containing 7 n=1 Tax=Maylandia zebra TaxID=106582 RepID=A0A3P9DP03_9CICH